MTEAIEINFDAIVGPTHNYSGIAIGNRASEKHSGIVSHPKKAALQGLEKMKFLSDRGIVQAIFPPQERPFIPFLRSIGYSGSDKEILSSVWKSNPSLALQISSASAMWAANSATMSPSIDSADGKVHITAANLQSHLHRSLETSSTTFLLKKIFSNEKYFIHHNPLPSTPFFSDEGSANHTRLCLDYGTPGIQLFVYGRRCDKKNSLAKKYYPRHSDQASYAIARTHQLREDNVIFAQQHPEAIDAGVFHNDVISVGNKNFFLYHTKAFVDTDAIIEKIKTSFNTTCHKDLFTFAVDEKDLSLDEAVKTYLFNSQIVSIKDDTMALIAPIECEEHPRAKKLLDKILYSDNPIKEIHYLNLRESMQNGGGPACLRCRFVLTKNELKDLLGNVILTENLYNTLVSWVNKHYRETLSLKDLQDHLLIEEGRYALQELWKILQL